MEFSSQSVGARGLGRIVGGVLLLVVLVFLWPFYSVPTGSRGVVTQFGRIVGIEGEAWPCCRPGRSCTTSASGPRRPT